jgi:hypothetical protein
VEPAICTPVLKDVNQETVTMVMRKMMGNVTVSVRTVTNQVTEALQTRAGEGYVPCPAGFGVWVGAVRRRTH